MIASSRQGGAPAHPAPASGYEPVAFVSPLLSFIIIARNQIRTIETCIESVRAAVEARGLPSYEIIYVDSASSDGTLECVQERYRDLVHTVSLTGSMNAAIARNVGAQQSSGAALLFLDGDMEFDAAFLTAALDANCRPIHPLISGQLPEKFYDTDGRFLGNGPDRYKVRDRQYRAELGGSLLVSRSAFLKAGGYRPELRSNEDLDFGLRLARAGTKALMLPQPFAVHHTVEYFNWTRLGRMTTDGSLCFAGVLFRRHLLNPAYWPVLIAHQRPTAVLALSVLLALLAHPAWILQYLLYVAGKNLRRPSTPFLQDLVGTTVRSTGFLLGVAFFFPAAVPAPTISFVSHRKYLPPSAQAPVTAEPAGAG